MRHGFLMLTIGFTVGALIFSFVNCGDATTTWVGLAVNMVAGFAVYLILYYIEKKEKAKEEKQGHYVKTSSTSTGMKIEANVPNVSKVQDVTQVLNQSILDAQSKISKRKTKDA